MQSFTTFMEQRGLLLSPEVAGGFTQGFLVGAIFVLLVVALILLRRHSKTERDCVTVESDSGTLYITSNAVREFVSRILSRYQAASLHGITLRQRAERLVLRIDMDVLPDTQVVPMVDDIRAAVISQAAEKLGITMPIRVDVSLRSLSAKEGKIVRQQRRAGVPVRRSQAAPEDEIEPLDEGMDMQEQPLDLTEEPAAPEDVADRREDGKGARDEETWTEGGDDGVPGPGSEEGEPRLPDGERPAPDAEDAESKPDSDKRNE